jgi:hypothetical protein
MMKWRREGRSVFSDDTTQPGALFQADDEDAARAVKAHNESLPRRSERAGEIAEEMHAEAMVYRKKHSKFSPLEVMEFAERIDSLTEPEQRECEECHWCEVTTPRRCVELLRDTERLRRERDGAVTRCAGLSNDVEAQSAVTAEHYRRNRRATQKIIARIGSVGPESVESAVDRVLEALARLSIAEDARASQRDSDAGLRARVKELEAELREVNEHWTRQHNQALGIIADQAARIEELETEVERLARGEESHSEEGDPVADALGRARAARECYNDTSSYQAQEDSVDAILDTLVALSARVTRQSDLVARLGGRVAELEEGK